MYQPSGSACAKFAQQLQSLYLPQHNTLPCSTTTHSVCRLLVVDQHQGDIYLLAVHTKACQRCSSLAHSWLQQTAAAVQALKASADADSNGQDRSIPSNGWHHAEVPDSLHTGRSGAMKPSCEAV